MKQFLLELILKYTVPICVQNQKLFHSFYRPALILSLDKSIEEIKKKQAFKDSFKWIRMNR